MSFLKPLSAIAFFLAVTACTQYDGNVYTLYASPSIAPKIQPEGGGATQVVVPQGQATVRPAPRSNAEIAFVRQLLDNLQRRSIAENREYCGFIALTPAGQITATQPSRGQAAGCEFTAPPANLRLLASYHTHAAYDYNFDNEVPSVQDLEGDISDQLDGYVSTPGGRIWYDNARAQTATLLCDLNCIYADPGFRPDFSAPINPNGYTLAALRARQG